MRGMPPIHYAWEVPVAMKNSDPSLPHYFHPACRMFLSGPLHPFLSVSMPPYDADPKGKER